jgi:hypothetical protein
MGQAKTKKANGKYPAKQNYQAKVMVANMRDITTAYVERASKLGYVMIILAIPDEAAHGPGSAQNVSVYGNIPDTATQVACMREIADKIENSVDMPDKAKLARTDN